MKRTNFSIPRTLPSCASLIVFAVSLLTISAHAENPSSSIPNAVSADGAVSSSSPNSNFVLYTPTTAVSALNSDGDPVASTTAPDDGFFHRLGRAYLADWAGHGPTTAVPQKDRRGTPGPIPSPPFPASDWPIGGTVTIGVPDGQTYPLMQAINQNKGVNKIYGFVEIGANGSTNNKSNPSKGIDSNFPSAYDEYSNTVQLDQAVIYF